MHNRDLTINSFRYDQFGEESQKKDPSDKAGKKIVLPNFDNEEVEEAADPDGFQKTDGKDDTKTMDNGMRLREIEKREAQLKIKENKMIAETQKMAEELIKQAQMEAEEIKKNAFDKATKDGYQAGYQKAYEEHKVEMDEETAVFLIQLRDMIQAFEEEKALLISKNIDELKELTIAIAEKVIQISLKTSGEIIKKMIITATNKMKLKEWAKIYISKRDSALIVESNADLLDAISHLSEHIKINVMEDSAPGTCIIELPDQIIDASASTQIENIRGIMKSAGKLGGNDIV
ncbi:MAG: FliH/SctL family protein [Anaerotignum sp.]|nr:FliH/SctL family protein [Anaerotignum sp.]